MRTASKTLFYLYLLTLVIGVSFYYSTINSEQYKRERWLGIIVHHYSDAANHNSIYEVRPLEDLALFFWDYAYFFKPGTTKTEIEEILGFKDKHIPKVVKEGYTQALFVIDNEVTCSIHSKKDYQFYLGDFQENYIEISYEDWTQCRITRSADMTKIILDISPEWEYIPTEFADTREDIN
jgi:hypothetical protein